MFSVWLLFFILFAPFAVVIVVKGAPFVPVKNDDLSQLMQALALKQGDVFIDYGSGNGATVRAAARRGARAIGYEINPFLVLFSRLSKDRTLGRESYKIVNMWKALPPKDATHIYTFLLPKHIDSFIDKLESEIAAPVLFISYTFPVKDREPLLVAGNSYVYELTPLDNQFKNK